MHSEARQQAAREHANFHVALQRVPPTPPNTTAFPQQRVRSMIKKAWDLVWKGINQPAIAKDMDLDWYAVGMVSPVPVCRINDDGEVIGNRVYIISPIVRWLLSDEALKERSLRMDEFIHLTEYRSEEDIDHRSQYHPFTLEEISVEWETYRHMTLEGADDEHSNFVLEMVIIALWKNFIAEPHRALYLRDRPGEGIYPRFEVLLINADGLPILFSHDRNVINRFGREGQQLTNNASPLRKSSCE